MSSKPHDALIDRVTGWEHIEIKRPSAAYEARRVHAAIVRETVLTLADTADLIAELRTRGYTVRRDELPACYPPMGDGDG